MNRAHELAAAVDCISRIWRAEYRRETSLLLHEELRGQENKHAARRALPKLLSHCRRRRSGRWRTRLSGAFADFARFKVHVLPSRIHRLGVFAAQNIPARAKVIEYAGKKLNRRQASEVFRERLASRSSKLYYLARVILVLDSGRRGRRQWRGIREPLLRSESGHDDDAQSYLA